MSPIKIMAIFLIMAAGVVGSYFIIKNSSPNVPGVISGNNTENKSFLAKPIRWISNIDSDTNNSEVADSSDFAEKISDNTDVKNSSDSANNSNTEIGNINLTQMAAQSLFGKMKIMDQGGKNPFQYFNPNDLGSKTLTDNVIQNAQNSASLFIDSINENQLKISKDNSSENKNNYLETAVGIILANPYANENPIPALDDAVKYGDAASVIARADNYKIAYDKLIALTAPSDLLDIHKRYLLVLKNSELTYRGIAEIRTDGIKAAIYLDALPQLLKSESDLRKEIYNIALELNSNKL